MPRAWTIGHALVELTLSLHGEIDTPRGLILECTRGSGAEIIGGHHHLVAGCTLRNIGTAGAAIGGVVPDLERRIDNDTTFAGNAGTDNGVLSCDVYDTSAYGIILGGGDRKTLQPGRHYGVNNDIHHFGGCVRTYRPAVFLYFRDITGTMEAVVAVYLDDMALGNVLARSISVRSNFLSLSRGRMPEEIQELVNVRDNLLESDPGFVAPEKGNFRLKDDSPALKLGFKPIPFDKIGPYREEYR